MLKVIRSLLFLVFTTVLLSIQSFGLIGTVSAQPSLQDTITLTGYLNLIYGDPPPQSNLPPQTVTLLSDSSGTPLAELIVDESTARSFSGQLVEVTGQAQVSGQGAEGTSVETFEVTTIQKVEGDVSAQDDVTAASSGSQPFVNILCQFDGGPHPTP